MELYAKKVGEKRMYCKHKLRLTEEEYKTGVWLRVELTSIQLAKLLSMSEEEIQKFLDDLYFKHK